METIYTVNPHAIVDVTEVQRILQQRVSRKIGYGGGAQETNREEKIVEGIIVQYGTMPTVQELLQVLIPFPLENIEKLSMGRIVQMIYKHSIDIRFLEALQIYIPNTDIKIDKINVFLQYLFALHEEAIQNMFYSLSLRICADIILCIPNHIFYKMNRNTQKGIVYTKIHKTLFRKNKKHLYTIRRIHRTRKMPTIPVFPLLSSYKKYTKITTDGKYSSEVFECIIQNLPSFISRLLTVSDNRIFIKIAFGLFLFPFISLSYLGYTKKTFFVMCNTYCLDVFNSKGTDAGEQYRTLPQYFYTKYKEIPSSIKAVVQCAIIVHILSLCSLEEALSIVMQFSYSSLVSLYKNKIYYLVYIKTYNMPISLHSIELSSFWSQAFPIMHQYIFERLYTLARSLPSYRDKELGNIFEKSAHRDCIMRISVERFSLMIEKIKTVENDNALALILQRILEKYAQ